MLKVRTLAASVTNLSDARYFASYGVDWITFPSSRQSDNLSAIKEIIEWCEGPQFAVELDEVDEHFASFVAEELDVQGFVVDHKWLQNDRMKQVLWFNPNEEVDLSDDSWEAIVVKPGALETLSEGIKKKAFVDTAGLTKEEVQDLIQTHSDVGLVLYGGQEEKVGFKSFEQQDEWIELLMD